MTEEPRGSPRSRATGDDAALGGVRRRAEERLGRAASLARLIVPPLRVAGTLGLLAGAVVWAGDPAVRWGTSSLSSAIFLLLLLLPGLRLHWHARRLQFLPRELPGLVAEGERTVRAMSTHLKGVSSRRAARAQPGSTRRLRRAWRIYREEILPLRIAYGDAADRLYAPLKALAPPALLISGIALVATTVLAVAAPVLLIARLLRA